MVNLRMGWEGDLVWHLLGWCLRKLRRDPRVLSTSTQGMTCECRNLPGPAGTYLDLQFRASVQMIFLSLVFAYTHFTVAF